MDIPSLFMIPSAVSSGKVHSVFPNSTDADFDFNRDSDATRVNSEGLIERVGYYSAERVTNGGFDTDSNWSKDGWKIENGKAINTLASSGLNLYQGSVTSVGNTFKVVLDAVISAGGLKVLLGGGSGGYNEIGQASSTGTHTFVGVSNGTDNRILIQTLSGSTIGSVIVDNVSVKQINGDRARLNYEIEGGLVNTKPSLLLEPQSTNLITYSEDFSQSYWFKDKVTATQKSIISPTGELNTSLIQETSYTSSIPKLDIETAISLSAGTYTLSFYVKNNKGRYLGISFGSASERVRTNFDFETNTFKSLNLSGSTTGTASFTTLGDFYRISITATFPSTTASKNTIVPLATDTYPFFALQDSDDRSFYIWGAMVEQQAFSTSYIPTNGSTQTRAAETCNGAGTSSILPTQGILFTEVKVQQTGSTNGIIFISNGTTSNLLMLRYAPSHKFQVEATGGVNIIEDSARASGKYKVAIKYSSAGIELWIDGSKAKETSTATTATGINELGIGSSPYGNIVGCNVFDARVYNTKEMTNSEVDILLTKITS